MTKKKEAPVVVSQTLSEQDYGLATAAVRYFAAPMRRRSMRAAVCLTVAALAAAFLPICQKNPNAHTAMVVVVILFALAAAAICLFQPIAERKSAAGWFHSCPLAALPETVTVSSDCAVVENECERMTEYWTDFTLCIETERLIAAAGGQERYLFVVKKDGLQKEEAERLSNLMRYAFDGRWYRLPPRKGGK